MKLYKDGHEAYVEKDQVELFITDGWSKTEPKVVDEELSEDSDESLEGSEDSEESYDDSGKTGKIRRPIKKK